MLRLNAFIVLVFVSLSAVAQQQQQPDPQKEGGQTTAGGGNEGGAASVAKGQELFQGNCVQCHSVGDNVVIGPGLKGVTKRRSEAWLIKWIHNNQKLIKSGDPQAVEVYNKFNQTQMPAYENFSDDDIRSILAYVEAAADKQNGGGGQQTSTTSTTGGNESSAGSGYTNILLGGLIVVLLAILLVLLVITSLLTKFLKQREGLDEADKEIVNHKFDLGAVLGSKPFLAIVGILFFLVISKAGIDKVMNIGVQTGYAPTQPISFSHKLHAGKYKIACQYCHTTVMKAKSASIPSANICMNCHNAIKQGSPEIQKIYAAIEKNQPIQWVRVHNLPDLAYFNHSQHTAVGQVQCTQCHGEIEKMEVVQQRSPLTMGWCIDCHRQTLVNYTVRDAEGNQELNPYYEKLAAFHKLKGKTKFTVEEIGGLECSKCHY